MIDLVMKQAYTTNDVLRGFSVVKVNCDGAKDLYTPGAGLRMVYRNEYGDLLEATAIRSSAQDALVAKVLVVREGRFIAKRRRWCRITVERIPRFYIIPSPIHLDVDISKLGVLWRIFLCSNIPLLLFLFPMF